MSTRRIQALVVDDEASPREAWTRMLDRRGIEVKTAHNAAQAQERATERQFDLAIVDYSMPGMTGDDLARELVRATPSLHVYLVTAHNGDAVRSARWAAEPSIRRVISKDLDERDVDAMIRDVSDESSEEFESDLPEWVPVPESPPFDALFIGHDPVWRGFIRRLDTLARSDVLVWLRGEPGVGKTALAKFIHARSARAKGECKVLHIATLGEGILESEMFGIRDGVATSVRARPGWFAATGRGTLVLDDIGAMPLPAQQKLRPLLQERMFTTAGSHQASRFDGRLVVTTNENIEEEVSKGTFRQDLYERIKDFAVEVPSLRALGRGRGELAEWMFNRTVAQRNHVGIVDPVVVQILAEYEWPGNAREMANTIDAMLAGVESTARIGVSSIPKRILKAVAGPVLRVAEGGGRGDPVRSPNDLVPPDLKGEWEFCSIVERCRAKGMS